MIVQGILDFLSQFIAGLARLIPPMPVEMTTAIGYVTSAGSSFATQLAAFGVIIPWGTFGTLVTIWWGAMTFWLAMLGVRLVLWIVGR